jgi:hypothetical protein
MCFTLFTAKAFFLLFFFFKIAHNMHIDEDKTLSLRMTTTEVRQCKKIKPTGDIGATDIGYAKLTVGSSFYMQLTI